MNSAEITLLKGDISGVAKSKILSEKNEKCKRKLVFAFACWQHPQIPIAAGLLSTLFLAFYCHQCLPAAAMSFLRFR